jgi:hypothetical protein
MDHELIEGWRECNFKSPPYLFPKDNVEILNRNAKIFQSYDEYIASTQFGKQNDTSLHIGLLPVPYAGNLEKASIFILMLNPGFSPSNYFFEQNSLTYRKAHIRTLRQENGSDDYPFIYLYPEFAWHPGSKYWQNKLQTIIEAYSKHLGTKYQEAMSQVSKKLACLELFPYSSKSFGESSLLDKLQSSLVMLKYVHDVVIPKAEEGKAVIIATRSIKYWNLPKHKNIIIYEGGETHAAHLSLKSRGGKAIAKHLGLSV